MKKLIKILLFAVLVILLTRASFIDIYRIPSDSMRNLLHRGDLILANKTTYGGILSGFFSALGFRSVPKRNEVYVFTINPEYYGLFVKRCIGIPGDVIQITGGVVVINSRQIAETNTVRHQYKVWYNSYSITKQNFEKGRIDLEENGGIKFPKYLFIGLDLSQLPFVRKMEGVDSLTRYISRNDSVKLSLDRLGMSTEMPRLAAFKIPYKGMKIILDKNGYAQYAYIIRHYENAAFVEKDSSLYISGRKTGYYTFKKNYYFMMGDNRVNAIDSRDYGPVPEDNFVGKYLYKL